MPEEKWYFRRRITFPRKVLSDLEGDKWPENSLLVEESQPGAGEEKKTIIVSPGAARVHRGQGAGVREYRRGGSI